MFYLITTANLKLQGCKFKIAKLPLSKFLISTWQVDKSKVAIKLVYNEAISRHSLTLS